MAITGKYTIIMLVIKNSQTETLYVNGENHKQIKSIDLIINKYFPLLKCNQCFMKYFATCGKRIIIIIIIITTYLQFILLIMHDKFILIAYDTKGVCV